MPTFWSGILLILLFAVTLGVMPSSGVDGVRSVILPSIALGALTMATFARVTRTAVLEELGRDYVSTAQAKGLLFRRVVSRHVLRNAATPIITISALEIANLLAGAVIVETVFAWPGLGQLAVQSIAARDFPIVQSIVLLGAFVVDRAQSRRRHALQRGRSAHPPRRQRMSETSLPARAAARCARAIGRELRADLAVPAHLRRALR